MHRSIKQWFTLIEMLVVIAIIGVLAAMLMPSLRSSIETAYSIGCQNNEKQIHMVYVMYKNDFGGLFMPTTAEGDFPLTSYGTSNVTLWSWMQGYYEGLPTTDWGSGGGRTVLDFFRCPKSNLTNKSYLHDMRRTSYSHFGYVWRFINDRDSRYGSSGGSEGLRYCLRETDIKHPSQTPFYTDSNGQNVGNAVVSPNVSMARTVITSPSTDPGTIAWGTIFLRHGSEDSYNVMFFDGHIEAFIYPDSPEGGGYSWCVNN